LAKLDDSYFGDGWLRLAPSLLRYLAWRRRRTSYTVPYKQHESGRECQEEEDDSEVHSDLGQGVGVETGERLFAGGCLAGMPINSRGIEVVSRNPHS